MSTNIKDIDFFITTADMLYSSVKQISLDKIIIFVILITFWVNTTGIANAAITADWGDVVDVHYFRYNNPDYTGIAEDNEIPYIYLSQGSTVPADVAALFPEANAAFFSDFKAGIIGLSVNEQNQFTALEGGTNYYFLVTLLLIRYDASGGESTTGTTSTTTTTANKDPLGDLGNLVLFGGGGAILVGGVLFWAFGNSRRREQALSKESTSVARREKSIKQKKTQLKELRELAESRESVSPEKKPEEPSDLKFRRRRK